MGKNRERGLVARNLVWLAIFAVEVWFVGFYEPGVKGRTKIHELYVYDALRASPRLHPWMEYADDLDYWLIESMKITYESAVCSFSSGNLARTPDIYVYTHDIVEDDWKGRLDWCLPHEVGHYIDKELGLISLTEDFEKAVELSIIMWRNLPEGDVHWRSNGEMLSTWPGVNGNPEMENGWGGYRELYASLHEIDYLIQMPPPLRPYFDEFIPWIW